MKTQRGHSAGVNIRTATGKIMIGPQPRQAEICCGALLVSIFSIAGCRRLTHRSQQPGRQQQAGVLQNYLLQNACRRS